MNHPAESGAPFHTVIHIGMLAADTLFVGVSRNFYHRAILQKLAQVKLLMYFLQQTKLDLHKK